MYAAVIKEFGQMNECSKELSKTYIVVVMREEITGSNGNNGCDSDKSLRVCRCCG